MELLRLFCVEAPLHMFLLTLLLLMYAAAASAAYTDPQRILLPSSSSNPLPTDFPSLLSQSLADAALPQLLQRTSLESKEGKISVTGFLMAFERDNSHGNIIAELSSKVSEVNLENRSLNRWHQNMTKDPKKYEIFRENVKKKERERRLKNKEVYNRRCREWWANNREEVNRRRREQRAKNIEEMKRKERERRAKNKEEYNRRQRQRRANNKEEYNRRQRQWRAKMREKQRQKLEGTSNAEEPPTSPKNAALPKLQPQNHQHNPEIIGNVEDPEIMHFSQIEAQEKSFLGQVGDPTIGIQFPFQSNDVDDDDMDWERFVFDLDVNNCIEFGCGKTDIGDENQFGPLEQIPNADEYFTCNPQHTTIAMQPEIQQQYSEMLHYCGAFCL